MTSHIFFLTTYFLSCQVRACSQLNTWFKVKLFGTLPHARNKVVPSLTKIRSLCNTLMNASAYVLSSQNPLPPLSPQGCDVIHGQSLIRNIAYSQSCFKLFSNDDYYKVSKTNQNHLQQCQDDELFYIPLTKIYCRRKPDLKTQSNKIIQHLQQLLPSWLQYFNGWLFSVRAILKLIKKLFFKIFAEIINP